MKRRTAATRLDVVIALFLSSSPFSIGVEATVDDIELWRVARRLLNFYYARVVAARRADAFLDKTAIDRIRVLPHVNLPKLTAYSFRHLVTTVLRRSKRSHGVTEDDISLQLGHKRAQARTTAGYGEWEPDYLLNCANSIDTWLLSLQRKVSNRSLSSQGYPRFVRPRIIETMQAIENNGGRDRDRTCDPYHVKGKASFGQIRSPFTALSQARAQQKFGCAQALAKGSGADHLRYASATPGQNAEQLSNLTFRKSVIRQSKSRGYAIPRTNAS